MSSNITNSLLPLLTFRPRLSASRGGYSGDWLNSKHTFSFSSYFDPQFNNFGCLRVLNEDRVRPAEGFPLHSHSNAEIFSYVVSGSILHRDSMGNSELLRRGAVQFTSAGSGIRHSEFNGDREKNGFLHFLQIWVQPNQRGLKPSYSTRFFSDAAKLNSLRCIVAPDGEEGKTAPNESGEQQIADQSNAIPQPIKINNDIRVYSSILDNDSTVRHQIQSNRKYYIHLIEDASSFDTEENQVGIIVSETQKNSNNLKNSVNLASGDGLFIEINKKSDSDAELFLTIKGDHRQKNGKSEFLLFDIADEEN